MKMHGLTVYDIISLFTHCPYHFSCDSDDKVLFRALVILPLPVPLPLFNQVLSSCGQCPLRYGQYGYASML
jgi:hypothetical protein